MDADDDITGVGLRQDFEEPNSAVEMERVPTAVVVEQAQVNVDGGHTPVLPVTRPTKRRHSPGSSVKNPIDLTSERQMCINGKMCELIDLSEDKVLSHECRCGNLLIHRLNRRKCPSDR